MIKLYYKKDTGYLCKRAPLDLDVADDDLFIEVDEATFNKTFGIGWGKSWAVIDNELKEVVLPEFTKDVLVEELTNEREECYGFLLNTDYVVLKLYEAAIAGDQDLLNSLKIKYNDIIAERTAKRARINEIEAQLKDI